MPQAEVIKSGISPIWILPVITVIIGLIVVVSSFVNRGYSFTLVTSNAEGIVAGSTVIKNRSVDVGIINSVEFSEDFNKVILHCTIDRDKIALLRTDTVFWTVTPNISATGVSGLSTIISGAYIELKPGLGDIVPAGHSYDLRSSPPASSSNTPGLRLNLVSELEIIVRIGSPVLYRGYKVGWVDIAEFDVQDGCMHYGLFIESAYEGLVTENVRFWLNGDFDFELSTSGVSLEIPPISTLLSGGISFDLPDDADVGERAAEGSVFMLHRSQKDINEASYSLYKEYLLFFDSSVNGLLPGAPVSFRGIRVGTVKDVPFVIEEMTIDSLIGHIPVLIHIEPERISSEPAGDMPEIERFLASKNLRASLKVSNLLTGALYVDINSYQNPQNWSAPADTYGYNTIPTSSTSLVLLENKLVSILDKLDKMPLEPVLSEADAAMREMRKLGENLNALIVSEEVEKLPLTLNETMQELQNTMSAVSSSFGAGSELYEGMADDLAELEALLKETRAVMETINNKSNALFFNADKPADPVPATPRR